jgi:hypothetical protein
MFVIAPPLEELVVLLTPLGLELFYLVTPFFIVCLLVPSCWLYTIYIALF